MAFRILDKLNVESSDAATVVTAIGNRNEEKTVITLKLDVNTNFGSVMDYFEIFMGRMIMCRKAAGALKLRFKLVINEQQLL